MIRVIVCDPQPIFRNGLRDLIGSQHDMKLVGEVANAEALRKLVLTTPCDVVTLDIALSGDSGLETLKNIRAQRPSVQVLVITMLDEVPFAARVFRAGGGGFLKKDCSPADVAKAIRKIGTGGKYVSHRVAESLASDLAHESPSSFTDTLSDREFEVLVAIGYGRTPQQISETLFLSKNTVSTYRARLLQKLHLSSNAELMRYAMTHHLSDFDPTGEATL